MSPASRTNLRLGAAVIGANLIINAMSVAALNHWRAEAAAVARVQRQTLSDKLDHSEVMRDRRTAAVIAACRR